MGAFLDSVISRSPGAELWQRGVSTPAEEDDGSVLDELRRQAVEEVAELLIHEVNPIIGRLRLYGAAEIPEYEESRTKRELDRLAWLTEALERLHRASSIPHVEEFDLGSLVTQVADEESREGVTIELAGPMPLVVQADRHLAKLILSNGLRNAIGPPKAERKAIGSRSS